VHSGLDQLLEAGAGGSSFHHGLEYCPAKAAARQCLRLFIGVLLRPKSKRPWRPTSGAPLDPVN